MCFFVKRLDGWDGQGGLDVLVRKWQSDIVVGQWQSDCGWAMAECT